MSVLAQRHLAVSLMLVCRSVCILFLHLGFPKGKKIHLLDAHNSLRFEVVLVSSTVSLS